MLSLQFSELQVESLDLCLSIVHDYIKIVDLLESEQASLTTSTESEHKKIRSETALFKQSIHGVNDPGFDLSCLERPRQQLMNAICSSTVNLRNIEKVQNHLFRFRGALNFYKQTIASNFDIAKYADFKNNNIQFDMQELLSRSQILLGVMAMIDSFGNEVDDMAEVQRILNLHPSYTISAEVRTVPCPEFEDWLDPVTYQLVPKTNNRCTIVTVVPTKPMLRYRPPLSSYPHPHRK